MTRKSTLFALRPAGRSGESLSAALPTRLQVAMTRLCCREYPAANDERELLYHVITVQDPVATRWRAKAARALTIGALGGVASSVVAVLGFDAHDGDLEAAVRLGVMYGAFFGCISYSVSRAVRAAAEIESLLPHLQPADVLVTWSGRDDECLLALQEVCRRYGMATALRR